MALNDIEQNNAFPQLEPLPQQRHQALSDEDRLRRLGKKPLLRRSFGFMSILGFSCSSLISWEGILVATVAGLLNGGPAGVIWGFLVNWIGMLSIFAVLAELSSMAPTAGGQYHWVAMMAPKSCRSFLAYITGWLTTLGWQTSGASTGYLVATIIQGMVVMSRPTYIPKPWHTMLLMWAFMFFAVLVNSTTSRTLARFEGVVLIVHLIGFFCVLIPLVYLGPHANAPQVFTTFLNAGGWSSQQLSFFVGLPASAVTLLGGDSAIHMSEEIQSAATVIPNALMWTVVINGSLAWAIVIAMMFCIGDLEDALHAQETIFYAFLRIFQTATSSTSVACIMASVIVVMGIASGVGLYASASRMLWAFSRDRGVPFHNQLAKLTRNSLPTTAILVTLAYSMLLSLIVLGSAVAFSAITILTVAALYSSYILVCILLLWCRTTGRFRCQGKPESRGPNLSWGPWHIPEPWGSLNNLFACVYLIFIFFWSFWPPVTPVTPQTFNFAVVVFGAVVLFSMLWYAVRAKGTFGGLVNEVENENVTGGCHK